MSKQKQEDTNNSHASSTELKSIQEKFSIFLQLLEKNNHVLQVMGDMEEKAQGEYLFDMRYIRSGLADIRGGVGAIIDKMIALGGEEYTILRQRYDEINNVLESILPDQRQIVGDALTVSFDRLNRKRAASVGSKNAQLGEMKSKLGLPVPEGFAITAHAYKHFVDANDLQARISRRIESLDIKSYNDLVRISEEIREMISVSPIPLDIISSILLSYRELIIRTSHDRISMRSSAIGEDTLFSFAGQYASYLNIREEELVDRYREVLASKFTPQAIYYFISHSLSEAELAMSVGCVSMLDPIASGVAYTRNPIRPNDDAIIIDSIFGLGKYLVNGRLTPDEFRVNRNDGSIISSKIARKRLMLTNNPEGGTCEEKIPKESQKLPSIGEDHIKELTKYVVKLEEHYRTPQDIEWAIDKQGKLYLLQSRPLHVIRPKVKKVKLNTSKLKILFSGGTTVCPGAGSGPVYHVSSFDDLPQIPDGAILFTHHPFPGIVTVMGRVSALVSRFGGLASHMATLAREYHVPTISSINEIDSIPDGQVVTVDATEKVIYAGNQKNIIQARKPDYDLFEDSSIHNILNGALDLISPLRLLHPADEDFLPENCMSFHDITRFAHQKSMEEMFRGAQEMEDKGSLGYQFKSDLPINLRIIYLDKEPAGVIKKKYINEEDIATSPMKSFWEGIKYEGWPKKTMISKAVRGMGTGLMKKTISEYSEYSFAVLGREYMMVSLRMGYHFTTFEAMQTEDTNKNYIMMQYKDGGATLDKRVRRIKLLKEILSRLGFVQQRKGDYLNAGISYQEKRAIGEKLFLLGRLTMMTKQLDMALSNDEVAEWYTKDFIKKLGIEKPDPTGE